MKPDLALRSFAALICAGIFFRAEPTHVAWAAAHDPHAAVPPKAAAAKLNRNGLTSTDSSMPTTNVCSRAEVETLIAKAGTTAPEWWDSVQLRYPPTLNLTWADPAIHIVAGPGNEDRLFQGSYRTARESGYRHKPDKGAPAGATNDGYLHGFLK